MDNETFFKDYKAANREMLGRMQADGVDLGTLVELELKEKVVFNLETTTVPTYHGALPTVECETPGKRTCVGYVAHFDADRIALAPAWNHDVKRVAEAGYNGCIRVDPAAVENYRILGK